MLGGGRGQARSVVLDWPGPGEASWLYPRDSKAQRAIAVGNQGSLAFPKSLVPQAEKQQKLELNGPGGQENGCLCDKPQNHIQD